jgi:hypothetical protein
MHPICQQTLVANFSASELQRRFEEGASGNQTFVQQGLASGKTH